MFHLIHPVSTCIWPLPKLIQCVCRRFLCCVILPASRNALHPLWPVQPVVRGRRVLRDTSWYGKGNLGILRLKQLRMGYVFSDRQRRRWVQIVLNFQGPTWERNSRRFMLFSDVQRLQYEGFLKMVGFPNKLLGFATKNDQPLGCLDWRESHHLRKHPSWFIYISPVWIGWFWAYEFVAGILFGWPWTQPWNSNISANIMFSAWCRLKVMVKQREGP